MKTLDLRNRGTLVLFAVAVGLLLAALFISFRFGVEPFWPLAAVVTIALALPAMRLWPIAIGVGLQFVGNFKTVPARGFDFTDPTMIVLLLCIGAAIIEVLFSFANTDDCSLSKRFHGQSTASLLFLMLCVCIAISALYTPSPQHGMMKSVRFAVFELLSFFYPILFLKNQKDMRQLVRCFVILGLLLSAKVLLNLLHPSESMMQGDTDITQIGDGMLLGIALLMSIVNPDVRGVFKYGSIAGLSLGLVGCAARSPLVTFLVTVFVTALFAKGRVARASRRAVSASGIFALLVIVPALLWVENLPVAKQRIEWKQEELESVLSGSRLQRGTVAARLDYYRVAVQALIEYPISGIGAGGWGVFYNNQDVPRYPHNFVLEVGAEQGIIGLSILLALLGLLLRSAFRLLRSNSSLVFVFPIFVFCLLLNLMTGDIEGRTLWFCFGLVAAASRISPHFGSDTSIALNANEAPGAFIVLNLSPLLREPSARHFSTSSEIGA